MLFHLFLELTSISGSATRASSTAMQALWAARCSADQPPSSAWLMSAPAASSASTASASPFSAATSRLDQPLASSASKPAVTTMLPDHGRAPACGRLILQRVSHSPSSGNGFCVTGRRFREASEPPRVFRSSRRLQLLPARLRREGDGDAGRAQPDQCRADEQPVIAGSGVVDHAAGKRPERHAQA